MLQLLPVHLQGVGQKCGRHHNILREDELATYPQGGWARGLFIVLSTTMVLVTTISSGRMSSLHILREDELENYSWFSLLPWYLATISSGRMSSLHAHMDDELENYSWFSLLLCWSVSCVITRISKGRSWALYISSVRMSSRTLTRSPFYPWYGGLGIYQDILKEQVPYISLGIMSLWKFINSPCTLVITTLHTGEKVSLQVPRDVS